LRISSVAHTGATAVTVAPADEQGSIEDQCIVFSAAGGVYKLRVVDLDGSPALKQRAPIVLSTCEPRVEATPEKFESNLVEVIP
jgi:hypothetical protein